MTAKRSAYGKSVLLISPLDQRQRSWSSHVQQRRAWSSTRLTPMADDAAPLPDLDPATLTQRSHAEYVEGKNLRDMVKENLVAERIAIDSYREIIQYIGDSDPTTRRIFEDILAQEEEHADDMSDLLQGL